MTTGQGLAIIGFWLPLLGAFFGSKVSNAGVWLAIFIGVVGTAWVKSFGG